MANFKRYFEEAAAYSVTTVTKERKPLFVDRKLCRILLVNIEYHKTIFDYMVLGYCLMPDHLHLILRPGNRFNLSYVMQMIKGGFARKVNKLNETHGSIWQRRYYDQVVRNENQLINYLDYIHYNPVAAGLVSEPSEYLFSSFAQYHNLQDSERSVLAIDRFK